MELNMNKVKRINALSLHELAKLINVDEKKLDQYILQTRDKLMEHEDLKISDALPKIVKSCNMDDLMLGAILAIFMADYMFSEYLRCD